MIIQDAKIEDGWLMLKTSAPEALKQLYGLKVGRDYDLKVHQEKRSRNANAYAWVLIGKLATELGIPKEEVYRHAIADIGGKSDVITLRSSALTAFGNAFVNGHFGRSVELLHRDGEIADVVITYGSSDFDRIQMAQLIDSLVADCQAVGIETKTDEEIASLLEQFEGSTE